MKMNRMYVALIASGLFLMTVACGGGGEQTTSGEALTTDAVEVKQSPEERYKNDPIFQAGSEKVKANGCTACHMSVRKVIGPSYKDVAERYEATDENVEMLAANIINGNYGNWGEVPMPPHPQISQDDAETMVRYILMFKD
ncbi:cytochrome c class I [Nitritalea halalkaliphila LW7]|uniref:Cytochrome c class I n=1 Tax=Nitritalea halalkaliphila LW7 TaxID=1189621 RepID=I5C491_9BACT|nr:c-type cytochrome [Nitritalea halalkaliphila]EIM76643.1 cytochrome c class I [Nitritalea halalkaliphila LW7]